MLNGNVLNSQAINFTHVSGEGQEGALVSIVQDVIRVEQGALVNLDQYVALAGSGALLSIKQDVELRISGSGVLIELSQDVSTVGSGSLIDIEQTILSTEELFRFTSMPTGYRWGLSISLGGLNLPKGIIQEVEVTHGIGDDSRAIVKLNPGAAVYDLYSYQGKSLRISARTTAGFKRIFTGIVDIPRVELVNEKIILEGVTVRETSIRNSMTPFVAGIGYYSTTVFGARNNVYQEINDRMSTIPSDLDFDTYGKWTVTSWTPKGTADITLTNSNIYRENQPEIRIESAREVLNKVRITLNYTYQRLHQASLSYTWSPGLVPCDYLTLGNTLPNRDMVRSAAGGAGWKVITMSFTDLWPSGWYHCGGVPIGWVNTLQDLIIKNNEATDSFNNNYSQSQMISTFNINQLLCQGAQWTARKRFTQNVQEAYTLTVNSPQSQSLYGTKEKNENLALQADFDPSQWEDEALYDTEFTGTKVTQSTTNYYINKDTEAAELNNAMITALNKARTDILASHRDTEISFTTFVNPEYQLKHTIRVNTTRLDAKGKVRGITHKFVAGGEATSTVRLALYRSVGSQSNSSLVPISRPSFTGPASMGAVSLQTHWGEDPNQPSARNWNGYVGNKWVTVGGKFNNDTYKTTYQESFTVDTPAIPALRRQQQNYSASASYNVGIPNGSLTITFLDS
jgi:hypothetical protein